MTTVVGKERDEDMSKKERFAGTGLIEFRCLTAFCDIISAVGQYQRGTGWTDSPNRRLGVEAQLFDGFVSSVQDCPIIVNLRRGILVVGREAILIIIKGEDTTGSIVLGHWRARHRRN